MMIPFKQYIEESLDRPYKWKTWKDGDYGVYYQFTSDNNDLYTVLLDEFDGLIFWLGDKDEYKKGDIYQAKILTNKKDFRVLSTIAHIVEDIIKIYKPNILNFDATSWKRDAVYTRMVKRSPSIKKYYNITQLPNTIILKRKEPI